MNLDRLLNPASIAVIGGTPAERAIENCDRLGFEGPIWPVHPTRSKMAGRQTFPSIDDLPGAPDAAFVAINRKLTIDAVHQLAAIGAGGAVLYASGFAEAGPEGHSLQKELIDGHNMPLIGPNCYGTINARSGAALWPDVHGCRRVETGPALISQSGNITLSLSLNQRGVDFTYALSLGNQASVTVEDCIAQFAQDPKVTAIGLYLEWIDDSVAFGEAALAAKASDTPIVVLKTGRSKTAGQIAASHTAAISSPSDSYSALFDRYGIIEVETLPEMMTVLSMIDNIGPLPGNRLISLSCSGGEASLVADRAQHHDIVFEPLVQDHSSRIKATLSDLVAMTNPLDYHTFIWGDRQALERCFTAALDGPIDAAMLILDWPDESPNESRDDADWWPTLTAIENASATTGTPAIVVASLSESLPVRVREHLESHGLGFAYSIDQSLMGLATMARLGKMEDMAPAVLHHPPGEAPDTVATLTEHDAKQLLADVGILIPAGSVVRNGEPPPDISYPVAAKIVGAEHKTEAGGVILDIADEEGLINALARLGTTSEEMLVEEMVGGAVAEMLISVRRDRPVGIAITIGAGGTLVELIDDTVTLLVPTTDEELRRSIASLKIGRLVEGHRGKPSADIKGVIAVVDRLTQLLEDRPDIVEVEINPLIVTEEAAWATDALVTVAQPDD